MSLPFKSDALVVVSGGASDPKIVAGTSDPITGFNAPEGSIYLRYVATNGRLYVKNGPGDTDWANIPLTGGGTLDSAYDFGGAGAGRTISADSGAVQINSLTADAQAALVLNRSPSSAAAAIGISLTLGANTNTSGSGISVTDNGTGTSISVTKAAAGVAFNTTLTDPGAQALVVAVNATPTSASPVSITANTTGTTATLVAISKIPGATTAGAGLSVSMGANTTGPAITLSAAGTGAALQIASGAIEVANSSPAVSAANTGRIKYDSATQRFQASLNGAAYADMGAGIGVVVSGGTIGSVLFVGASGVLQQDNANFFWDDTNNRLGIGTAAAPSISLDVHGTNSATDVVRIQNNSATGFSAVQYYDSGGTAKGFFGYGNASVADTAVAGRLYWRSNAADLVITYSAGSPSLPALHISGSTGAITAGAIGVTKSGFFNEFTKDGSNNNVIISSYGTSVNAEINLFRGRGTGASTTAVQSSDVLGQVAYCGATTSSLFFSAATMVGRATENWSGTAAGSKIETYTTANTTATRVLRTTIDQDGVLYVEGSGIVSKASSFAAGFFNTALFGSSPGVSFAQADRNLRIQAGSNSGGQRYQYLTFNGRWSGNIDSPTLTQGLFDRVCGIEFNAAADSLGPNPNSSINFFVNTGTKSTGSETVVTPTRAMTITYTARVGIGQVNPSQPFDVETILGNTNAKFGASFPIYTVSNNPNIGFNAYFNSGWKLGKGSTGHYACVMGFDPTTPVWSLGITTVTGAADAAITPTTRLSVSATGVVTVSGLASTTIDAIVLSQASTGALRVQDPTSPGFGYDYNNHRLTINTHPAIMFASVDVTNTTANMASFRNTNAYSSTSGSLIYLAGDLVPSATGQRTGGITFGGWNGGGAFYREGASIQSFAEGAWTAGTTHPAYLSFSTTQSGSSTPVERLRIASSGAATFTGVAATDSLILSTGNIRVDNGQAYLKRDHATDGPLFVQGTNAGNVNPSAIGFLNQASSFRSYVGYYPSSYAFAHLRLLNGWFAQAGEDIAFANTTENAFRFGMTSNSAFLALANGGSASVSAANTGRLIYNTTGQKAQWSFNGAAYFDAATYASALTTGSVPFANGSNQLAQDNANFFWDDTNNRLGIGTASPAVALDVRGAASFSGVANASNILATNNFAGQTSGFPVVYGRAIGSYDTTAISLLVAGAWGEFAGSRSAGSNDLTGVGVNGVASGAQINVGVNGQANGVATVNYGLAGSAFGGTTNWALFTDQGDVALNATNGLTRIGPVGGTTGVLAMNGGSTAAVSAASTGRLRYNESTNKFQVSLNGAAYVDVSTGAGGGMSIGGAVTSGTTGSLLFVGSGPVLAQDNANLFWDDTNNRLGIGTATPAVALDVVGSAQISGVSNGTNILATNNFTGQTNGFPVISGRAIGSYDTTVSFLLVAGVWGEFAGSRSAGGNPLAGIGVNGVASGAQQNVGVNGQANGTADINYGLAGTAYGGTLNYALYTDQGDVVLNNTSGTTDIKGATTLENTLTQKAHANFSGSGSVQTTGAVQTTDATQTVLYSVALPDTSDTMFEVRVVGRDTAGTERAVYGKVALVYREGGGATIQGSIQDIFPDIETSAGLDATITVSGNNVRVSVTGLAATTINWAATIRYQSVSGSA